MQEKDNATGSAGVQSPAAPAGPEVPPTKARREAILRAVRAYVQAHRPVAPLSLAELQTHTQRLVEHAGVENRYRPFAGVLLNNEVWKDPVAAVPFHRRLLLLPKCLRDPDRCQAKIDEMGLLCAQCGSCPIGDLKTEAQSLGYVVLVAEGTAVVTSLIAGGRIEAVVGVSCLSMLAQVFPYMEAAAIPAVAIPLLHEGCARTKVDLEWAWDALHLCGPGTPRLDLDQLRTQVEGWFAPCALEESFGPADSPAQRLALEWLARGGKRWRPLLAAGVYRAFGGGDAAPLPTGLRCAALAVECFHKASLVHDDIEDDDEVRYGQQTLHVRHGVPIALNVGDLLLGEGYRLIAQCDAPDAVRSAMLAAAAEGHRTLCIGQGQELAWMREPKVLTSDDVTDIFSRKTAPAFEVALQLGALYAGADPGTLAVLSRFSRCLGVAYQIHDDLEDFASGGVGGDLRAMRPSLLLALAYERARGSDRPVLEALWRRQGGDDVPARLERILRELDVEEEARRRLDDSKEQAIRSLCLLKNTGLKTLLRRVICKIFNSDQIMECCREHTASNTSGDAGGPGSAA